MEKAKSTEHSQTFYEVRLHPGSAVHGCDRTTLGSLLRQTRLSRGLSLRKVAFSAGLSPMGLSLLERDACGPPSDEKLENLVNALGELNPEHIFARAGRVMPRVARIILKHPIEWSELLLACEHLGAAHVSKLKEMIVAGTPEYVGAADVSKLRETIDYGPPGMGKASLLEALAANIRGNSPAMRRAQLEQIVEAAEKEEKIQRTSCEKWARRRAGPILSKLLEQRRTKKKIQRTPIASRAVLPDSS